MADLQQSEILDTLTVTNSLDTNNLNQSITKSQNIWHNLYLLSSPDGDQIELEDRNNNKLTRFVGIVSVTDDHRDAAGALFYVAMKDTRISGADYSAFTELSYRNADGDGRRKYDMIMGTDGYPRIRMRTATPHGSWNSNSHNICVTFFGDIF